MQEIINFFSNLSNPEWIMQHGGLLIVMLIVFIESGLFFGFFLPGDPLLFIAGMVIANTLSPFETPVINLAFWIALVAASGIIGNYVGYWFGRRFGGLLLQRKDNWLFKKSYLEQARIFYEKKGGTAMILARFLPIVRTFAPIIAGIVKMDLKKFTFYNIAGSFLWTISIISVGFLLGENKWAQLNLEKIILGIVLLTTAPVVLKMLKGKKRGVLKTIPVYNSTEPKQKKEHSDH